MRGSRAAAACGVAWLALAACRHPPGRAVVPEGRGPGPMSTWVWETSATSSPEARERLLRFARRWRVSNLFVHASPEYDEPEGFEDLAALDGAPGGAALSLVIGDPAWALPEHHTDAVSFLKRARRLDERLEQRRLRSVNRVLFDVEPYLLPAWRSAPDAVTADYLALLGELRRESHAAGLEVWHTIPFWFSQRLFGGASVDRLVLEQSDGVVVMAYRDTPEQVTSVAASVLDHAAAQGKPAVVAVETLCVDPAYVSFCGKSPSTLNAALDRLATTLGAFPAFAGLAVHQYRSWSALEGEAP